MTTLSDDRAAPNVGKKGESYHKRYTRKQHELGRQRRAAYVDKEVAEILDGMVSSKRDDKPRHGDKQAVTEAALQVGARTLALIRDICPQIETGEMTALSVELLLREALGAAPRHKPGADLATVAAEIGPLVEDGIEMQRLKTLQQLMRIKEETKEETTAGRAAA
mgnify:CR=1 FL=1